MNNYQRELIREHYELYDRINNLKADFYLQDQSKDEHADVAVQLTAMRIYEEALRSRLNRNNIVVEDGNYFEQVAGTLSRDCPMPDKGNDCDKNSENMKEDTNN